MRGRGRSILLGLLFCVVFAAIIPAVLFGEPRRMAGQEGGDAWRNIIFDFQTLITGFAAVGAAFLTIAEMRLTDTAAERRHQETKQLAITLASLAASRLASRANQWLRSLKDETRNLSELQDASPTEIASRLALAILRAGNIKQLFGTPEYQQAQQYFNPDVSSGFGLVASWSMTLGEYVPLTDKELVQAATEPHPRIEKYAQAIVAVLVVLGDVSVRLADDIDLWSNSLRDAAGNQISVYLPPNSNI